jgi:hypothetical protein
MQKGQALRETHIFRIDRACEPGQALAEPRLVATCQGQPRLLTDHERIVRIRIAELVQPLLGRANSQLIHVRNGQVEQWQPGAVREAGRSQEMVAPQMMVDGLTASAFCEGYRTEVDFEGSSQTGTHGLSQQSL